MSEACDLGIGCGYWLRVWAPRIVSNVEMN